MALPLGHLVGRWPLVPRPANLCQGVSPALRRAALGQAGQLRSHTCHMLAQALGTEQLGLLSVWSKRQVLDCKLAELALGGVNKKGIVL